MERPLQKFVLMLALWVAVPTHLYAQSQVPDLGAAVDVTMPAFESNAGPIVGIDSAHNNFHTLAGRYAALGALLANDGYRVKNADQRFSPDYLSGFNTIVIANARAADGSALTDAEVSVVATWVAGGGSLLLIVDHRPFAAPSFNLMRAFGFTPSDGIVARDLNDPIDIFTLKDGSLHDGPLTRGRNVQERVTAIGTFGGSGFGIPKAAKPILTFPPTYRTFDCRIPCPKDAATADADGLSQGAILNFGKGRVAVFSEAAMFSAQILTGTDGRSERFGFNAPGAEQNKQFILNLAHWLVGLF